MFHTWISTDTEEHDSCLTCGGMWTTAEEHPTNWTSPRHTACNGEPATDCTRNTSQCHHYAGECSHMEPDACQIDPDCNCLFCY